MLQSSCQWKPWATLTNRCCCCSSLFCEYVPCIWVNAVWNCAVMHIFQRSSHPHFFVYVETKLFTRRTVQTPCPNRDVFPQCLSSLMLPPAESPYLTGSWIAIPASCRTLSLQVTQPKTQYNTTVYYWFSIVIRKQPGTRWWMSWGMGWIYPESVYAQCL